MDELYDQSVFAFNQRHVLARSDANNAIATATIGKPERFAYGSDPVEGVDVWKTRKPNAPVLIYLHGGGWQSGRSADFALYAEPYINAGAHFVSVDFTNVRATKGDLFPLVDQCRRAVGWTYRNADKFGGDPERLYLCSRSSGSHLAGCVVTTDWQAMGLPRTILKGAVMGSGMYDLKPVRLSARSKFVAFTDEMEQQLSAQRHIDKLHTPLVLCIGTLETPEFQRQSRRLRRRRESGRQAGRARRRRALQSLRGRRYHRTPVPAHRPGTDEDDEAVDDLTYRHHRSLPPAGEAHQWPRHSRPGRHRTRDTVSRAPFQRSRVDSRVAV